jgi:adenylylsulfate kinase
MGLPGAGKTYLAKQLNQCLRDHNNSINEARITVAWINADDVRKHYNDWDFSREGRIRQSSRMRELADKSNCDYCIVDFVAPLVEMRDNFAADITIWMDTIQAGRFEDTNKMFDPPKHYDYRVQEQDADKWARVIADDVLKYRQYANF